MKQLTKDVSTNLVDNTMESVTFCRRGGTVMDPDYTMNVMTPVNHNPHLR